MAENEFERKEITTDQLIVFVVYECEKCGKEVSQYIGESWKPNKKGEF